MNNTHSQHTIFDKLLAQFAIEQKSGVATIIAHKGNVIYRDAKGKANIELDVPLTAAHVFRIGSLTKQFTAAAILILQERGQLALSDDIHRYIPDHPTEGHRVTIEHLLTHTAGLSNHTDDMQLMMSRLSSPILLDELIELCARGSMHSAPGEAMQYSNDGYILLGKIIEVVGDCTYAEFLDKHIFKKLGMVDTQVGGSHLIDKRVSGYTRNAQGVTKAMTIDMSWPYAAGALVSTVDDLQRWFRALGQGKVISAENLHFMTNGYTLNNGTVTGYGYGLGITQ